MLKMSKQMNLTGVSAITVDGKEVQVAIMNASIPAIGMPQISKGIQNHELFQANKETIVSEFAKFDEQVYEIMSSFAQE